MAGGEDADAETPSTGSSRTSGSSSCFESPAPTATNTATSTTRSPTSDPFEQEAVLPLSVVDETVATPGVVDLVS